MSTAVLIVIKIPTAEQQVIDSGVERVNESVKSLTFTPLYDRVKNVLKEINVTDAVWQLCQPSNSWRVSFTCCISSTDFILQQLAQQSIGSYKNTYVGIVPYSYILENDESLDESRLQAPEGQVKRDRKFIESKVNGRINAACEEDEDEGKLDSNRVHASSFDFRKFQNGFLKSITARMTVAQVASSIKSNAEITFDFLMYVLMASWIAAMGLIEDSTVNLVAAMLVSPLMGPVLAVTFGTMVRANDIRNMGLRNSALGFLIPIVFGFIFGFIVFFYLTSDPEKIVPTAEMKARGDLRNLLIGTLVALPSGAAVSLAILSGAQSSLIGVAISASLLPPCVNAGLLWSHASVHFMNSINEDAIPINRTGQVISIQPSLIPPVNYKPLYFENNIAYECLSLACVSFCLTVVNILSIFCAGLLFLKIKEITPLSNLSAPTARFFKEDIKIARQHNVRRKSGADENELKEEIVREWANATGLDANRLLTPDALESKMIQSHTLQDIMQDVNSDSLLRKLRRDSHSISPVSPDAEMIARRHFPDMNRSHSIVSSAGSVFRKRPTVSFTTSLAATASSASIDMAENSGDIAMTDLLSKRRKSQALLRQLTRNDHSPYSMWPRVQESDSRMTSEPSSPFFADGDKYRDISMRALASYEDEIHRKQPEKPEKEDKTS